MTTLNNNASGERSKIMTSQINYITKGQLESRLNYEKIAKLNLPIGSGAVESLIRQAVNLRLKGNGKFWLRENAETLLHARCQWLAGSVNNFCSVTARINPATTG